MKILLIISLFLVQTSAPLFAQEKPAPAFKMVEFHMALLKRGPQWTDKKTPERAEILAQHLAYVISLLESGKTVIGGPLTDDGEIRGLYVLRAKSAGEAREWADADPAVKAGHFSVEMHPWWSEEVMKKAASPVKRLPPTLASFRAEQNGLRRRLLKPRNYKRRTSRTSIDWQKPRS